MRGRVTILLFLALASGPILRGAPAPRPAIEGSVTPPRGLSRSYHILVEKAARRLILYGDGKEVHRYPVGLGFAPSGSKEKEGDGKTPEGTYRVCMKNPRSSFHLSLGVSYPNAADAVRGFETGLITKSQRDRIAAADRRRGCPPWDTPLGGVIFIHGNGARSDWTLGCVALEDEDIEVLYRTVPVGTPVTIRP